MDWLTIGIVAFLVWYWFAMHNRDKQAKRDMTPGEYQRYLDDTDPANDNSNHEPPHNWR